MDAAAAGEYKPSPPEQTSTLMATWVVRAARSQLSEAAFSLMHLAGLMTLGPTVQGAAA